MSITQDGGPAFPFFGLVESDAEEENGIVGVKRPVRNTGMSLRDWLAGKAMQSLIATGGYESKMDLANDAVDYADALIRALRTET